MSDKESTLRLNLAAAGMLSMLQQLAKQSAALAESIEGVGEESEKTEKKVHPMLASAKKGLDAAGKSALDLGGKLKNAAGLALTLGGSLSFGMAISKSQDLVNVYKDLAFAVRTSTDEAYSWRDAQKDVEAIGDRWGQSNDKVAKSYHGLVEATRDLDFAKKASESVAKLAAASGKPIENLTNLAGELGTKFGITGDEMDEAMAAVVASGRIDELSTQMKEVGSSARLMGKEGKEGLVEYIAMLNLTKGAAKDIPEAVGGITAAMEALSGEDSRKAIEKKLAIKLTTDTGELRKDAIEQVLAATGGDGQELGKIFSGSGLKIMTEFGKVYSKAFDGIEGTFAEKSAAGIDGFNAALKATAPDVGKALKEINDQAEDGAVDAKAKLMKAMDRVIGAFAQPKMLEAIDKVADKLPALADALAKFVDFAADNPMLTGVGLLAAKPMGSFAGSMMQDGAKALGKKGLDMAKGTELGKSIAASFSSEAAKSGKWATAGKALGVAGAAIIAYEVGKALLDSHFEDDKKAQDSASSAGISAAQAMASGDQKKMLAAREQLKAKVADLDERESGASGVLNQFLRGGARIATGDKTLKGANEQARDEAKLDLEKLERALAKGQDKGADAIVKAAQAFERAAGTLNRAGGGGEGTNGLPPKPSS